MITGVVLVGVELVADPLLVLESLVDNAIAEQDKVGGEWQGPSAGDSWMI